MSPANGQEGRIHRGALSHAPPCSSAQVRRGGGQGVGQGVGVGRCRAYLNLSPAVNHAYRERHRYTHYGGSGTAAVRQYQK